MKRSFWFWRKAIGRQSEKTGAPYRTIAEVPPQPKIETQEEKEARMKQEEKNRNIVGAMAVTMLPSIGLLTIGYQWNNLSASLATTSIFALVIFSVGVFISTGIKLDWFVP